MMKTTFALAALLALVGTAAAGLEAHVDATVNGETRTVDVIVGDDGSATVLIDGQPPALPPALTLP